MDLAAFTDLVAKLVRDDDGRLETTDIDMAVTLATNRYSKDRPNVLIEDVVASAGTALEMPASWNGDFSTVKTIEYPLNETPPCYFGNSLFFIYRGPGNVEEIRFVRSLVTSGATARVTFTARHADPETFEDDDIELVASFAAAYLCEQLAALYGHSTDTVIQADSVDHVNKGRDFAIRAKSLRGRYEGKFKSRTSTAAASAVAVVEQKNSGGDGRLFH